MIFFVFNLFHETLIKKIQFWDSNGSETLWNSSIKLMNKILLTAVLLVLIGC